MGYSPWPYVNMKIYSSCASPIWDIGLGLAVFAETAPSPMTIPSGGRLGFAPDTDGYGPETAPDGATYDYRFWKWNSPPMCKRYLKFALEGVSSSLSYSAGGSSSWPDSTSPACSTSLSGAAAGDIHVALAVVAPVADDITDFVNNNAKGGRRELRFKS